MFWKKFASTRKQKVDERTHVNPTISLILKEQIERLAFILGQPVNAMGELLFIWGISEREVIERLSKYFVTGYFVLDKTMYIGHETNEPLNVYIRQPSERISIRFDDDGHHDIELFTFFLDLDKAKTVAIIMSYAIKHPAIIEDLLQNQNNRMHFDEVVISEMKKLMKFVNHQNPYKTGWNSVLVRFLEGPKKRPKNMIKPMTKECIDTETYRWSLD